MEKKRTHDNDDEIFSFISLAALTANVVRHLQTNEQKNSESGNDANRSQSDEQKRETHRAYVDQRLRDLAAFERRSRGQKY